MDDRIDTRTNVFWMDLRISLDDDENLRNFGVYTTIRLDIQRKIFGFDEKVLYVKRQMLKSGVHWVLVPVKTIKANRKIDLPDKLIEILQEHKTKQEENKIKYNTAYKATETVRVRMKKGQDDPLTGGDFINRMDDGQLLTPNSMKSWTRNFKNDLNIEFKYHYLRHTHASTLAALNYPLFKLMDRLGHNKIDTTRKYSLGKNEIADRIALNLINTL